MSIPQTKHSLYICYFGLREPLVQTQVIPYLREILKDKIKISLLTFEPNFKDSWNAGEIEAARGKLAEEGISWHCLSYHKRPSVPATIFDIFNGAYFAARLSRREKIDVFHARAHVAALMGAIAKTFSGGKVLFDIRGFLPEEYTDAGIWKENGLIYRSVKRIEKWLLKKSDGFVVLTEKARAILFPESLETGFDKLGRPVEVIPCCVDIGGRFKGVGVEMRAEMRQKLNLDDRFVMVYVGAFGGWYLTEETADLFAELKKKRNDAFAMILTQSQPEIMGRLLLGRGYKSDDFLITQVSPAEIPQYLSAADVAVSFIKPCYSKLASSPTKNAEYLACGLPIITNGGVGDVESLIERREVGVLVRNFEVTDYINALTVIDGLSISGELCKNVAVSEFDLVRIGGKRYRRLYACLLESGDFS